MSDEKFLKRATEKNGLWDEITLQWEAQCAAYDENFVDYATASLPVLADLAQGPELANQGVYSYCPEGQHLAILQANAAFLPSYTGRVLRIRHIVFAPDFDFGINEVDDYIDVLASVFVGSIDLSYGEMSAPHVKFHLRSPAERAFGTAFTTALGKDKAFKEVNMRGAWIYLSKA